MTLEVRPTLAEVEPAVQVPNAASAVGPYQVLQTLGWSGDAGWILGYDMRLLRKVWIRQVPEGTPAIPSRLREVTRASRLRWLAGRRTAEENWDAFEAVSGEPLLALLREPQPWRKVRFWLYDLAREVLVPRKGMVRFPYWN